MPLLRFDLFEGREKEEVKKILDAAHYAMVEAFNVPESDRYQIVHQHPSYELVMEDTGLGFTRTNNMVIISITSKKRTDEQKQKLYRLIAERLEKECAISKEDLLINITENGDSDWSFGLGEAQFLTGKL